MNVNEANPPNAERIGGIVRCVGEEDKRDGTEAVPYGEGWGAYFLFHSARVSTLATPQSATPTAPLRGAPRGRCLFTSPKSLPRSAAPSRESGTKCRRGRRRRDQSRVEKRTRTKCCEGRLLSRPLRFLSYVKYIYQKHRGEAVIGDDGDEVVHGRDQRP